MEAPIRKDYLSKEGTGGNSHPVPERERRRVKEEVY